MEAILNGIYGKFSDTPHNDLYNAVSGRLYFAEAPQDKPTFPYVVYFLMPSSPEHASGSYLRENITIQMSIFSKTFNQGEVCDIYDKQKALFDECDLTVTGYSHMRMFREFSHLIREPDSGIWHYATQYEIWIEQD